MFIIREIKRFNFKPSLSPWEAQKQNITRAASEKVPLKSQLKLCA